MAGANRGPVASAATHERRAVGGREDHLVAAHLEVAVGVAGVQMKARRRQRHLRTQEARVEVHDLAVHRLSGLPEQLQRAGVVEPHAHLGGQPLPAGVERGQVVALSTSRRGIEFRNMGPISVPRGASPATVLAAQASISTRPDSILTG